MLHLMSRCVRSSAAGLCLAAFCLSGMSVVGCDSGEGPAPVAGRVPDRSGDPTVSGGSGGSLETPESPGPATIQLPGDLRTGKVEFRDADGKEVYSFKPKEAGTAKFYDADGTELCKLTLSPRRVKGKSADDQPMFELKRKNEKLMVKDATGEKELFKFKLKGDDLDFYDTRDNRLYRIRKRDDGYRVEDNADKTLFRARAKDGKMVLRDADDKTILSTKDLTSPLGLTFFAIKELTPEQQAACLIYFLQ